MKQLLYIAIALLLIIFCACSKNGEEPLIKPKGGSINAFNINKTGTHSDTGFKDGDKIGLYVVARPDQLTEGMLQSTGNMFDNIIFTYKSGVMNADVLQTYPSGVEWVDMYGYSPYLPLGIDSGNKLQFSVQSDQSSSLAASDLLWVAKTAVQTTAESPVLMFSHKLTKLVIKLTAGVGVTLTEPTVELNNMRPTVELNIQTGGLSSAQGSNISILPLKNSSTSEFEAIIIPQHVTSLINFITITNGSTTYTSTLQGSKFFESGKIYNYRITVNADNLSVKISGSVQDWGSGDTTTGDATQI